MVEITETFFARDRLAWRSWLSSNHAEKQEIWLIFLKKHVKEPCVPYPEAVEEALCFGWIDGILKRIDDREHAVRFSPRRKDSVWSRSNLERVERLLADGRMTPSGLAVYLARNPGRCDPPVSTGSKGHEMPLYFLQALDADGEARATYQNLPPSHKSQFLFWITSAKREETRHRRARKAVELLRSGKGPGGFDL